MTEPVSDEDLMARYVAGSDAAFVELFNRFAGRLHGFFLRSVGHAAAAEDLVQQTFLKIHRHKAQYRGDAPLRPWIFAIASRIRLDFFRQKLRRPEIQEEDMDLAHSDSGEWPALKRNDSLLPSSPDQAETSEREEWVQRALGTLSEGQRAVVHLHRFEGMTFAEIGQALHISEGTARVRACRAYEQLRELLKPLFSAGGAA